MKAPRDSAIFYSGGEGAARKAAEKAADDLGKVTLGRTPGGKWLDEQRLFDQSNAHKMSVKEAGETWDLTSRQYARQASGDVRAYIKDPQANSTYYRIELPALREGLATGRITSITVHDLATGATHIERAAPLIGRADGFSTATASGIATQGGAS